MKKRMYLITFHGYLAGSDALVRTISVKGLLRKWATLKELKKLNKLVLDCRPIMSI